jgi:hypothetical protein
MSLGLSPSLHLHTIISLGTTGQSVNSLPTSTLALYDQAPRMGWRDVFENANQITTPFLNLQQMNWNNYSGMAVKSTYST